MEVLEAVVELTPRRVNVPATRVLERLHGPGATSADRLELRLAVLRLERDGLIHSDSDLLLEATPAGLAAVALLDGPTRPWEGPR